jgi:hypothetical protein
MIYQIRSSNHLEAKSRCCRRSEISRLWVYFSLKACNACSQNYQTEEGNYALVSYENKAPPQAWRIDKILREGKQRLVLAHSKSYNMV